MRSTETKLKERILEAAAEILQREGARKLTQPEVARALGIRQSHLTYYFPRRADLLMAMAGRFLEKASATFATLSVGESGLHPLSVIAAVERLITAPDAMRTFIGLVVEADQDPVLRTMLTRHMEQFDALVARQLERRESDPAVCALLAAIRGMGLENVLADRERMRGRAETIARQLGLIPASPAAKSVGRAGRATAKAGKRNRTP